VAVGATSREVSEDRVAPIAQAGDRVRCRSELWFENRGSLTETRMDTSLGGASVCMHAKN
jgi:hypothetical protein